jgi:fumarate hydratase class II
MTFRTEKDKMGELEVSEGIYYGSQTAHSFLNLDIGIEKIPQELDAAFALLMKAPRIAGKAHVEGITLKDSALTSDFLSNEDFDSIAVPARMTGPQKPDIEKNCKILNGINDEIRTKRKKRLKL